MTARRLAVLPFVLVLGPGALAGCGDEAAVDPAPAAEVRAADSPVRLVEEADADLVLYVSNQSFDDETVRLEVSVDGVTVVDGNFDVGNQHEWVQFPLALGPGRHELRADSDSGATLRKTFTVPADEPRYAVVDHWGANRWGGGDTAELTWLFQAEPVAFS